MKIIKSFLLITVALSTTTLLHAQEVKATANGSTNDKSSTSPAFKPMNGVAAKEALAAAVEAPSPFKKEENKTQMEQPKVEVLTIKANGTKNNLTPEQFKTLNGTAEKPKQTAPVATLDAQKPLAPAPVVIKEN